MSGGSFDYMYSKILDTYKGELRDRELEEMLEDFCEVLRKLEWWQSCDISEESYAEAVKEFKNDWLLKGKLDRACFPIVLTTPGIYPDHSSAYFDPTRHLIFTGYMTEELAKNLGFKWCKE